MNPGEGSQSNILEFFMLVGKLKHLKRTGWIMRNISNCEDVAGHMYRMGIMAFLLEDEASLNVDRNKCIKMALVHDIAECIVGDLTPFCGISKEEKHRKELEAMERLSSLAGDKVGKEFLALYKEYEEQKTVEAKTVKDLDKFDMILQAFEYEKESNFTLNLQDFFNSTEALQVHSKIVSDQNLQQFLMPDLSKAKYYKCPYCSKIFPFKSMLNQHILVHTKEKPFKCSICNQSFQRKEGLRYHQIKNNHF
ncbi:5'-deoxynucleotidase HDDC2-like isoform X1 [Argiope bruennichi]|uniref:5'-deoxynucleotidase HDDC2-like isoform X1 n=1 Tax=Argiope bruennichi TaxID=94029 RepID=UPI00249556B5|nr:5'-deoxynucleotidase HDDC2-like isoform X1 [Argiope bruennichi]